jgi:hypothetical protein
MAAYASSRYPFRMQFPAGWSPLAVEPQTGVVASFGTEGAQLDIAEEDVAAFGAEVSTVSGYTDLVLAVLQSYFADFTLISRQRIQTTQGHEAEVVEYTVLGGQVRAARLIYLSQDLIGFSATFTAQPQVYSELKPALDYAFTTFEDGE